jgi:hypothetical protein
LKLNPLQQIDN